MMRDWGFISAIFLSDNTVSLFMFMCRLQEVRFTLDRCSGAAVMEMEGLGSWLTTKDHSACEVTVTIPNTDRYTQIL